MLKPSVAVLGDRLLRSRGLHDELRMLRERRMGQRARDDDHPEDAGRARALRRASRTCSRQDGEVPESRHHRPPDPPKNLAGTAKHNAGPGFKGKTIQRSRISYALHYPTATPKEQNIADL